MQSLSSLIASGTVSLMRSPSQNKAKKAAITVVIFSAVLCQAAYEVTIDYVIPFAARQITKAKPYVIAAANRIVDAIPAFPDLQA